MKNDSFAKICYRRLLIMPTLLVFEPSGKILYVHVIAKDAATESALQLQSKYSIKQFFSI